MELGYYASESGGGGGGGGGGRVFEVGGARGAEGGSISTNFTASNSTKDSGGGGVLSPT